MDKDREYLNLAGEMSQNRINQIARALNPVGKTELPFVAFALYTMLDNMMKYMDESQKKVFESMKELFGSECHTQRYDRREAGEAGAESNEFPQDTIREKNKKRG